MQKKHRFSGVILALVLIGTTGITSALHATEEQYAPAVSTNAAGSGGYVMETPASTSSEAVVSSSIRYVPAFPEESFGPSFGLTIQLPKEIRSTRSGGTFGVLHSRAVRHRNHINTSMQLTQFKTSNEGEVKDYDALTELKVDSWYRYYSEWRNAWVERHSKVTHDRYLDYAVKLRTEETVKLWDFHSAYMVSIGGRESRKGGIEVGAGLGVAVIEKITHTVPAYSVPASYYYSDGYWSGGEDILSYRILDPGYKEHTTHTAALIPEIPVGLSVRLPMNIGRLEMSFNAGAEYIWTPTLPDSEAFYVGGQRLSNMCRTTLNTAVSVVF